MMKILTWLAQKGESYMEANWHCIGKPIWKKPDKHGTASLVRIATTMEFLKISNLIFKLKKHSGEFPKPEGNGYNIQISPYLVLSKFSIISYLGYQYVEYKPNMWRGSSLEERWIKTGSKQEKRSMTEAVTGRA